MLVGHNWTPGSCRQRFSHRISSERAHQARQHFQELVRPHAADIHASHLCGALATGSSQQRLLPSVHHDEPSVT